MDQLSLISAVVKTIFGAIFGYFIGVVVMLLDFGIAGMIVGALLLGYLLFATSVIEIGGALILGFIIFAIGSYFNLVDKVANKFLIADTLGWATWTDTFFSLLVIFMVALIIVKILWGIAMKDETVGLPESINWGCGAIIGLILAGILFWGASSGRDASIIAWVLGGGVIGFLLSFIPGPPLS